MLEGDFFCYNKNMIDTSIIILNWNGREHLETCLQSVLSQSYKQFRVIVVDNGSDDGSVDFVKKNYPDIEIIINNKNLGFAEGNNIGIRRVLKDKNIRFIATLNNDTEVKVDWLEALITLIKTDDNIGAVSSKMLWFDKRDVIDSTGDYFLPRTLKVVTRGYKEKDTGQYDREEECLAARAGAALYRRDMLEDIRLGTDFFDKKFFAYIEDIDLSIRARLRGWKIMYAPHAVVYHKVAATTKRISYVFRRYQSGRNRIFAAIKNYPIHWWPFVWRGRESVDSDYRLGTGENLKLYLKIVGSLIVNMPRLLIQRNIIQERKTITYQEMKKWREQLVVHRKQD